MLAVGKPQIEPMTRKQWALVSAIHQDAVARGTVLSDGAPLSWEQWDAMHLPACRWTAHVDGALVGFGALGTVLPRTGVAELRVHVDPGYRRRGVGRALCSALVWTSEEVGLWTLQANVVPSDEPSHGLALSLGFRIVGRRERFGRTNTGAWTDVVLFERRSKVVGG